MASRHFQDMPLKRLQDRPSRRLQDISSRRLQDVFSETIFHLPRRLEDVLKRCWIRLQNQQMFAGLISNLGGFTWWVGRYWFLFRLCWTNFVTSVTYLLVLLLTNKEVIISKISSGGGPVQKMMKIKL